MPVELIVMTGGDGPSPEERMMTGAWQAATEDWVGKARQAAQVSRILIATNSAEFAATLRSTEPGLEVSIDTPPFHFGERLRDMIITAQLAKPFYAGAGSGILFTADDICSLADTIDGGSDLLVANNFYSSDFVAFTPGSAILRVEPPDRDNDLAWRLGRDGNLEALALPPSASSLFDVDTPVDLMIASIHPGTPPRLWAYLGGLDLDTTPVQRALRVLRKPGTTVVLAGRVGAAARGLLEDRLGCQVLLYAEERGMLASGRAERGEARSLLGHFVQESGPEELFRVLAGSADLLLLDSRVILSHFGAWPSSSDRFLSDLMKYKRIEDPLLRRLTEAAAHAPIPVVLGGHSLVSGGLYALVEIVERERGLGSGGAAGNEAPAVTTPR